MKLDETNGDGMTKTQREFTSKVPSYVTINLMMMMMMMMMMMICDNVVTALMESVFKCNCFFHFKSHSLPNRNLQTSFRWPFSHISFSVFPETMGLTEVVKILSAFL
jgi:hypothetical protein